MQGREAFDKLNSLSIQNEFHSMDQDIVTLNHAYTAAKLAFNRSQDQEILAGGEFSQKTESSQRNNSKSLRLSTESRASLINRQKSVRFTGPNAVLLRKSIKSKKLNVTQHDLAHEPTTSIPNISDTRKEISPQGLSIDRRNSQLRAINNSSTIADTYNEYFSKEQNLPLNPSSYRRIQKSKSMFCPVKTDSSSNLNHSMEISENKSPILSHSRSLQSHFPRIALRVSQSTDYLWTKWHRSESHDSALNQARDRFLHDMRKQNLRERSSIMPRSKLQRLEKNLLNSFRNSSTDYEISRKLTQQSSTSKMKDFPLRDLASRASKSFRSKFKKTFGWSDTVNTVKIPPQQVVANIRKFNSDPCTFHDAVGLKPNLDQESLSHVVSFDHTICKPGSKNFTRSCIESTFSRETIPVEENSRVTSWNSSVLKKINSKDELSLQSQVNHGMVMGKSNDFQNSSESTPNKEKIKDHDFPNPLVCPDSAAISSAGVYSALMRRLKAKHTQTAFEASRKMSSNSLSFPEFGDRTENSYSKFQGSKSLPTIKCISPGSKSKTSLSSWVEEGNKISPELDSKNADSNSTSNSVKLNPSSIIFGNESNCQIKKNDGNDRFSTGMNLNGLKGNHLMRENPFMHRASIKSANKSYEKTVENNFRNPPEQNNLTTEEMDRQKRGSIRSSTKMFQENKLTFFSGGTVALPKATSPFRRAMYEGVYKPHLNPSDQLHRFETQTPESSYSESIYSRSTSGQLRDTNANTSSSTLERDEKKKRQSSISASTGGDAVIIERSIYTPKFSQRNRHQHISPINSSEWKAWMSSEVAKLNYGRENVRSIPNSDYASLSSPISQSINSNHFREDAQISNEDFQEFDQKVRNVPLTPAGVGQQQISNITKAVPSKLFLKEQATNLQKESILPDPSNLILVPPVTPISTLRTIQSKNSMSSINSKFLSGSPTRFPKNFVRGPLVRNVKSKTGLISRKLNNTKINIENFGLVRNFPHDEQLTSTSSAENDDTTKFITPTISESSTGLEHGSINVKTKNQCDYKPDWWTGYEMPQGGRLNNNYCSNVKDLKTVGSKKMVEMFLSSRRKRIASSSFDDNIETGSSVFL